MPAGTTLVAPPANGRRVCKLPRPIVKEINAAIWDNEVRNPAYRQRGVDVAKANGLRLGVASVTRHAGHTEATWRHTDNPNSLAGRERPLFPLDYESVTDRATGLGMAAMETLPSACR